MTIKELMPFFCDITQKISVLYKECYRRPMPVELKDDLTPVTMLDRNIEELITYSIESTFGSHKIHGEEFGIKGKMSSDYEWVIDPLDGTKTFIQGVPFAATIIALLKGGEPIIGMYYNPILNDLLIGDNKQCFHNGVITSVRQCSKLSDAVILTTDHFNVGKYRNQRGFDELAKKCRLYRTWADAYGYFLIATGFADILIDPIVSRWDILPIIPIIRGANGCIFDYHGGNPIEATGVVAAPPNLMSDIIQILNKYDEE